MKRCGRQLARVAGRPYDLGPLLGFAPNTDCPPMASKSIADIQIEGRSGKSESGSRGRPVKRGDVKLRTGTERDEPMRAEAKRPSETDAARLRQSPEVALPGDPPHITHLVKRGDPEASRSGPCREHEWPNAHHGASHVPDARRWAVSAPEPQHIPGHRPGHV